MNTETGKEQRYADAETTERKVQADIDVEILNKQLDDHKDAFYQDGRLMPVQCKVCGTIELKSAESLRELGWSLSWERGERCPKHK